MAKISEQLDALIVQQQAEIDRIQAQTLEELAGARRRMALLQGARAKVTPDLDTLAEQLTAAGIWPGR